VQLVAVVISWVQRSQIAMATMIARGCDSDATDGSWRPTRPGGA